MPTYLITLDEIREYSNVSQNIDTDINVHINNAQMFDLRRTLGDDLYNRVISEVDGGNPSQAIIDLQPYYKPVLVYFTLAELYRLSTTNATRYGIVNKLNEFSEEESYKRRASITSSFESRATQLASDLVAFIEDNAADYPEFEKTDTRANSVGFFTSSRSSNDI